MTTLNLNALVPIEVEIEDNMPMVKLARYLTELDRRYRDAIAIDKAKFLDLADSIIEMRFRDAFDLMESVAPNLFNADQAHNAQLDYILAKNKEGN